MRESYPRHLTILVVVLLVLAAFIVGYQMNGGQLRSSRPVWAALAPQSIMHTLDDSASLQPVQLFSEVLNHVKQEYVEPIKNTDELTYAAIRGMLSALDDPYTRFMDPKETKEFNDDNAGHFAGIGAVLTMTEIPSVNKEGEGTAAPIKCPVCGTEISESKRYRVSIVEAMKGTPALAAGLQAGDFILKVDDKPTDGLLVGEVANMIRGKAGTQVTLTIARKEIEKPLTVTLTRAEIQVDAIESKMLDDNIGYLRILQFNEKTRPETSAALMDFNKAGVRGLVLDLRSNPGGLLMECVQVTSMFLPSENRVIVSTKGRDGKERSDTRIGKQIFDRPVVVLVNKGSASASEILTGALKDYKRATIVGENTFGKGLVQSVVHLNNGSSMAVTIAHYYTPSGYDLHQKGIAPDLAVTLDKEVKQIDEKDNQAQAAIRILKEEIAKRK